MNRRAEAIDAEADTIQRGLVAAGVINSEPEGAQDYQQYFLPKSRQVVFGAEVFALDREEEGDTYIGCCVDPGYSLIVMGDPTPAMSAFADEFECKLTTSPKYQPDFELGRLLEAAGKKGQAITEISCRYDDLRDSTEGAR